MKRTEVYRSLPDDARTLVRANMRQGKWPELDDQPCRRYLSVYF